MGGIQQCVKDVLRIATRPKISVRPRRASSNCSSKLKQDIAGIARWRNEFRDQIDRAYNDVPLASLPCLDRVLEWLDRDHLRQRRQAD